LLDHRRENELNGTSDEGVATILEAQSAATLYCIARDLAYLVDDRLLGSNDASNLVSYECQALTNDCAQIATLSAPWIVVPLQVF
jgi:hypothetical protein